MSRLPQDSTIEIDGDFSTALDEDARSRQDPGAPVASPRSGKASQSTTIVRLAEPAELFHTEDGTPYATIPVNGHRETWALRSTSFRRWLGRQYHEAEQSAPGAQAMNDALLILEGKAVYEGPEEDVFNRFAGRGNRIYIDMGDPDWTVLEVTRDGWNIAHNPHVRFRRPRGMAALPCPAPGGSVNDLRPFVNVKTEADWMLTVAWLLAAMRPTGPYPVLCFVDEQGTGKTTTARRLVGIADPSCPALRCEPKNPHDLAIAADANWILALDNLSYLKPWLSDCLCRLATGGGFSTRALYTDNEESLFDAKRPVILTGIDDLTARGDLMDRAIHVSMNFIREGQRRPEREMDLEFEAALPGILGAFLTVISGALRDLPTTKLSTLPRMADFALWIAAAERHLGWTPGAFARAYSGNRADAHNLALESSAVGSRIRELVIGAGGNWTGTAGALLEALTALYPKSGTGKALTPEGWPKTARGLSSSLRRAAPHLRAIGVDVAQGDREGGTGKRLISISMETIPEKAEAKSTWEEM